MAPSGRRSNCRMRAATPTEYNSSVGTCSTSALGCPTRPTKPFAMHDVVDQADRALLANQEGLRGERKDNLATQGQDRQLRRQSWRPLLLLGLALLHALLGRDFSNLVYTHRLTLRYRSAVGRHQPRLAGLRVYDATAGMARSGQLGVIRQLAVAGGLLFRQNDGQEALFIGGLTWRWDRCPAGPAGPRGNRRT